MMIVTIIILTALVFTLIAAVGLMFSSRFGEIKITDKAIDMAKIFPIQNIEKSGFIVNGNGDITIGFKLFLPEVFTLTDEAIGHIHSRILALFKMLPAGTVIHQQNFYYTSKYENKEFSTNIMVSENLNHFNGKDVLNSYSNIYVTFTNTETYRQKKSATNTSLLRKLNIPFKQPFRNFSKLKEEMESVIMNFENGLSSINKIEIIRMEDYDLNNAIFDFVNLSYDKPTGDATSETVSPITTHQGDLKIGNKFIAILSLTGEGEKIFDSAIPVTGKRRAYGTNIEIPENIKSKCSMIYPLGLGLPFDHVVNTIIEITDADTTVTQMRSEKDSMNLLSNFYQRAKEKQIQQQDFCDMVVKEGYQTTYTAFNVILSDTDKITLNQKIALAKQGFSQMNSTSCYIENAETANLFFCSIPGNARANYRGFVNITQQALCYLQTDNLYISHLEGFIFSDRFGNPVLLDLWNYPELKNRNRMIFGPSGSGKSFWENNVIGQSHHHGRDIMIIDVGGSYRDMILLNHGKYFDSRVKENFKFNPFLCEKDNNGNYIYIDLYDKESSEDLIKTITAILAYIWKKKQPILQIEVDILTSSVIKFYVHVNHFNQVKENIKIIPSMIEYAKFLTEHWEPQMIPDEKSRFDIYTLSASLVPYTTGALSYLLNATENIDIIHDKLIAFDMESVINEDYFPVIGILTLQLAMAKIKRREGVAKELHIDEAVDFLTDEKFGDFIGLLFRTFRKKNGSITIAAQNVLFLNNIAPKVRDSIIINCATKIILDHSGQKESLQMVQNNLGFSDSELKMIESIQTNGGKWKEFFIKLGEDPYVFRTEVSEFSSVAFDSKQETMIRVRDLFKETQSMPAAINRFIQERREEKRREEKRLQLKKQEKEEVS